MMATARLRDEMGSRAGCGYLGPWIPFVGYEKPVALNFVWQVQQKVDPKRQFT